MPANHTSETVTSDAHGVLHPPYASLESPDVGSCASSFASCRRRRPPASRQCGGNRPAWPDRGASLFRRRAVKCRQSWRVGGPERSDPARPAPPVAPEGALPPVLATSVRRARPAPHRCLASNVDAIRVAGRGPHDCDRPEPIPESPKPAQGRRGAAATRLREPFGYSEECMLRRLRTPPFCSLPGPRPWQDRVPGPNYRQPRAAAGSPGCRQRRVRGVDSEVVSRWESRDAPVAFQLPSVRVVPTRLFGLLARAIRRSWKTGTAL